MRLGCVSGGVGEGSMGAYGGLTTMTIPFWQCLPCEQYNQSGSVVLTVTSKRSICRALSLLPGPLLAGRLSKCGTCLSRRDRKEAGEYTTVRRLTWLVEAALGYRVVSGIELELQLVAHRCLDAIWSKPETVEVADADKDVSGEGDGHKEKGEGC